MEFLRADHLFLWRKGETILKDVSLTLHQGDRIGLVGRNGSGKTTLLELLSGKRTPDDGKLIYSPGIRLSYLTQQLKFTDTTIWNTALTALEDVRSLEQKLREEETRIGQGGNLEDYRKLTEQFEQLGGYEAETLLTKSLSQFGFLDTSQNAQTLSGGEQMRLALVMALVRQPDILLLDEPTNHLDIQAKRLLGSRLKSYPDAVVIASHDRAFLDLVCTHTALLKDATLTLYKGNYSRMQGQRGLEQQTLQKKIRRLDTQQRTQSNKDIEDPRVLRDKERFKHLTNVDKALPILQLKGQPSKKTLITAKHLSKKIIDKVLLDDVSLRLESGDKVALLGANGTGKSTLLKILSGETESDNPKAEVYFYPDSKVFSYDQTHKAVADDVPILEQLTAFVSDERAKMLLALVNIPRQHWLAFPTVLSGGERGRLGLAKLIASEASILLLDEPTNDLDIGLIERLEDALASSTSATIFVSHDERFIENIATRIWSLENGKLVEYQGGINGYFKKNLKIENVKIEKLEEQKEETDEEKLERLELERRDLEDMLLDSVTTSERDYERAKLRHHEVIEELSALYDKPFPAPLPRYQMSENGIEIHANLINGHVELFSNAPVTLRVKRLESVAHVSFQESEETCLLPWVRVALLNCLTRLSFLYFDAKVVQYQFEGDVSASLLKNAGEGWWVMERSSFEEKEGYLRKTSPDNPQQKRKKKRFRHFRKRNKPTIKITTV
jgi:ATPase subunit of ABC transporter with duplicated ATPase domains